VGMTDSETLKLVLGICLIVAGALIFSIWRERLRSLKEEDRAHFLMYNLVGGSWLFAVFSLCGGGYFLLEPILKMAHF
jgi:hypothetical protein